MILQVTRMKAPSTVDLPVIFDWWTVSMRKKHTSGHARFWAMCLNSKMD